MAWITSDDVEPILQTDLSSDAYIDDLIAHVQGLAEAIIGTQTEPVSSVLSSTFAQIVARFWRAGQAATANPAGFQAENVDDYGYTVPTGAHLDAGLGLTNREKKMLRTAVGRTGLWVQPTTRGPVETAPTEGGFIDDYLDGALPDGD